LDSPPLLRIISFFGFSAFTLAFLAILPIAFPENSILVAWLLNLRPEEVKLKIKN
jgi:hypothetical protein